MSGHQQLIHPAIGSAGRATASSWHRIPVEYRGTSRIQGGPAAALFCHASWRFSNWDTTNLRAQDRLPARTADSISVRSIRCAVHGCLQVGVSAVALR